MTLIPQPCLKLMVQRSSDSFSEGHLILTSLFRVKWFHYERVFSRLLSLVCLPSLGASLIDSIPCGGRIDTIPTGNKIATTPFGGLIASTPFGGMIANIPFGGRIAIIPFGGQIAFNRTISPHIAKIALELNNAPNPLTFCPCPSFGFARFFVLRASFWFPPFVLHGQPGKVCRAGQQCLRLFPRALSKAGCDTLLVCRNTQNHFPEGLALYTSKAGHAFALSRKQRNRLQHAVNGNTWCGICNCSLIDRSFEYMPSYFHSWPITLKNGMMIHKFVYCQAHLSLWFCRRGRRQYQVLYGTKARNLYTHLCAARAASGTPGGHGQPKNCLRNLFALHGAYNRQQITQASGHESRCASGGRTHQQLRSTNAMLRRQSQYQLNRAQSRRDYRKWIQDVLGDGKFTLVHPRLPLKRVTNSPLQIQRAFPRNSLSPTSGSRADLFKRYVQRSCLDLPQRTLPLRPEKNQLHVITFNIETLIGHAKHESLAMFARHHSVDIIALQETKSQSSDELRPKGGRLLLSGTPQEHMAGVGFYVAPTSVPLISDFLPYSGRLAVLTLRTQPLQTHLVSVYAPSQLSDVAQDAARKEAFWSSLQDLHDLLPKPALIIYLGDFNARVHECDLLDPQDFIGPVTFPSPGSPDSTFQSNFEMLTEFLANNEFLLASSFHTRPASKRITYREIASEPSADPLTPTPLNFSCIDHILTHRHHLHNLPAISSQVKWNLPWFHRHYPLYVKITFDAFAKPADPPAPKIQPPATTEDKREFRASFLRALAPILGTQSMLQHDQIPGATDVYTDGSCPDQYHVAVGNPAGWAFTFQDARAHLDSYGPVGLNLPQAPVGSNNSGELQAILEALDYVLRHRTSHSISSLNIFTDSQFALDLIHGLSTTTEHTYLLSLIHKTLDLLLPHMPISILKIKGHSGQQGNDRADSLAKRGVSTDAQRGRHAPPVRPLVVENATAPAPAAFLDLTLAEQAGALQRAAIAAAPPPTLPTQYKRSYLSNKTKRLIDIVHSTPPSEHETLKRLRKIIKRRARKEKRQHTCDNLLQDSTGPPSKQWSTLRFLRKSYNPKTKGVRKPNGRMSTSTEKPQVFANHLSTNVWNHIPTPPLPSTLLFPPALLDLSPFDDQDLQRALSRLKHRKAAGPDGVPAELWKFAPRSVHIALLAHFNKAFKEAASPDSWKIADVIMIFKGKKKDPTLPESYRPISLINTVYKIYASMIHYRLKAAIDDRISTVQFGFRSGRSTSTPLFIIRRLIELHERHQETFYALFLDWAQAFDSVTHVAIENALLRIGVHPAFTAAILSIYQGCQFAVKDSNARSSRKQFSRGIRQGCPLSPYLFIITLSVLFQDTYDTYKSAFGPLPTVLQSDSPLCDIEYADDTVLLSRTQQALHRLLHTLQSLAFRRGMSLNIEKCHLLTINTTLPIYLIKHYQLPCTCDFCVEARYPKPDPSLKIEPTDHADYLGAVLTTNASATKDTNKRYAQASQAAKSLKDFFRHPSISVNRKLLVHNQLVLAILLYGSESQMYSQANLTKLNKLHYQVLRQIFNLKSSYYHKILSPSDQQCSNEYIAGLLYEHAPAILSPSQRIISARISYLGHILRHADTIEHQTVFQSAHAYRRLHRRRVGHPRLHWPEITMTQAYQRYQARQSPNPVPKPYHINDPLYQHLTASDIAQAHSPLFGNTDLWRNLHPIAQSRREWRHIEVLR